LVTAQSALIPILASIDTSPNIPELSNMSASCGPSSDADAASIVSDLEKQATRLTTATTRRTLERFETRPTQDASDVLDLPYGTLNDTANMNEFTEETAEGIIPKRTVSRIDGQVHDHELVTFTIGDVENPKNFSKLRKWYDSRPWASQEDGITDSI
jgi:hypothetical protein